MVDEAPHNIEQKLVMGSRGCVVLKRNIWSWQVKLKVLLLSQPRILDPQTIVIHYGYSVTYIILINQNFI